MQQTLPSLLHLQNAIDQIAVAGFVSKRQGCFQAIPLQNCAEFSLPQRNHSGMQIHPRGQGDEVTHIYRHYHLVLREGSCKHGRIRCACQPQVDNSFSRYARFTGPTRQAWAQVFIDQELQGAGAQPRWRRSAIRGRPGGLGMRA